jgi:hypothetical protein
MSDVDPEKKPPPPKPPITLDYIGKPKPPNHLDETSFPGNLPLAIISGILLGLFGPGFLSAYAAVAAFSTEGHGMTDTQFDVMIFEIVLGLVGFALLLSSIIANRPRRRPFFLGFLGGLCVVCLLSGMCWYSSR